MPFCCMFLRGGPFKNRIIFLTARYFSIVEHGLTFNWKVDLCHLFMENNIGQMTTADLAVARSIHPIFWYILVDVSTYSCLNHVLETLCCSGIVDVRFIFYPNSKENSFFRDYSIFDKGPKPTPSQTSLFFFSIRALIDFF